MKKGNGKRENGGEVHVYVVINDSDDAGGDEEERDDEEKEDDDDDDDDDNDKEWSRWRKVGLNIRHEWGKSSKKGLKRNVEKVDEDEES